MTILSEHETARMMHSYGIKCDKETVKQWVKDGTLKGIISGCVYEIHIDDVEEFLYDYRWNGTAFERGIDDSTKIQRLLDEVYALKHRVLELENINNELNFKLGEIPF